MPNTDPKSSPCDTGLKIMLLFKCAMYNYMTLTIIITLSGIQLQLYLAYNYNFIQYTITVQ